MIPQEILNQLIEYSSGCIVPSEALEDATFGYSLAQQTIKEKDAAYDRLYKDLERINEYDLNLREENKRYRNGLTESQNEIERLLAIIEKLYKDYFGTDVRDKESRELIDNQWQQFAKQHNL